MIVNHLCLRKKQLKITGLVLFLRTQKPYKIRKKKTEKKSFKAIINKALDHLSQTVLE